MAKQYYLVPERLIRALPVLRRFRWFTEALLVKTLVRAMQAMRPERAGRFANAVFRNARRLMPFTGNIRRNLCVAFPDKDALEIDRLTERTCGNLGIAAAELVLAERIWAEREQRIEFVTESGTDLRSYRGRPVVMVTGHIGAWQIAGYIAAQYGLPMTSIYAPEKNPYLRQFIFKLRSALPLNFLSRDGCMRGLTKQLKQGNAIGLTSDTRLDSGAPVPFFGVSTPTNTTAARLAIRHHCDFFPVRAERLPGMKYRITLCRPIQPDNPDASMTEQARQMTEKLFELFEEWIRDTPDQWMCFGRRWPRAAYGDTPR